MNAGMLFGKKFVGSHGNAFDFFTVINIYVKKNEKDDKHKNFACLIEYLKYTCGIILIS